VSEARDYPSEIPFRCTTLECLSLAGLSSLF
jgi:hypothetical protein